MPPMDVKPRGMVNGRPTVNSKGDLFPKPLKLPPHHDSHLHSAKIRPIPEPITPDTPTGGAEDIESILKMMKSSVMTPLDKIAATPRTEMEVQQPNKPLVYAGLPGLPPLFRQPQNPRKLTHFGLFDNMLRRLAYRMPYDLSFILFWVQN